MDSVLENVGVKLTPKEQKGIMRTLLVEEKSGKSISVLEESCKSISVLEESFELARPGRNY